MDNRHPFGWRNSGSRHVDTDDDPGEGSCEMIPVERLREELAEYEHPFFDFEAREKGDAVELVIRSKVPNVLSSEYHLTLSDRDIQSSQFRWTLQKLLYDSLTDYVVELFTKNP
jgi:hypothetical protein